MAARKYVYLAELDRFGYDMRVVETSEEKAINAMLADYIEAFISRNGFHPAEEESDRGYSDGGTWLDNAKSDIIVTKMAFGEVEWT